MSCVNKKNEKIIQQLEEEQCSIVEKYAVVEIAFIQNIDLSLLLFQKGFIPHLIFMDGLGWADGFIFKLDRDYFFLQFETLFTPFYTEVYTTCFRPEQQSIQILFDAFDISVEGIDIFYHHYDIQYISIQSQLNLQ